MKTRTALLLAALILLTGAAFADDRTSGAAARDRDLGEGSPLERASSRVPQVPYYLDGVLFPAGHPLPDEGVSIVLGRDKTGTATVNIFTNKDVAKEYRRQEKARNAAAGRLAEMTSCDWPETYAWFNTAVGCGNSGVLTLSPGNSYTNLDFGGWNNTISCVKAACYVEDYTVLYACRNFQMYYQSGVCDDPDDLWVPTGHIYTNLNNYGFNNRTSSIQILP